MTIVAGFKTYQGIVLCADTQETVGNLSKRNVPKLRFEPVKRSGVTAALHTDELAVAFCGAADNGVFMDEMVDRAWKDVQGSTSLDEACDAIRKSIKSQYKDAKQLYHAGETPQVELIYGVKMHGKSRLFVALGSSVTERDEYATAGIGLYLADFLSSRMYKGDLDLRQCVILAAYILFQAKEHVDGCGGDSHIAVLRNHGVSGMVNQDNIRILTELAKIADLQAGELVLGASDLSTTNEKFIKLMDMIKDGLNVIRDGRRDELRLAKSQRFQFGRILGGPDYKEPETDEFGLPTPSGDQTEGPEQ